MEIYLAEFGFDKIKYQPYKNKYEKNFGTT